MATVNAIPREADWNEAPGLMDGAMNLEMTAEQCNLEYWIPAVAQGTWQGLVNGHTPQAETPEHMRADGPLRDAAIQEFAFRSMSEDKAVRALGYMVDLAPDVDSMEFFATQLIDEARHAMVFRNHLLELGVPRSELLETMERVAGEDRRRVLDPVEEWGLPVVRDNRDFYGAVVLCTVLIEGVLAPFSELGERKWAVVDPAGSEIDRGANIDEIRHLTVGAGIVRRHLQANPEDADRLVELITEGRELWLKTPVADVLYRRECLYQQGLEQIADVVGDYEIEEGRRLIDTTPEDRLGIALKWSAEVQDERLRYMLLDGAIQ